MTFQDEFREAAEEYARRLDEKAETERLAALILEARRADNAGAFAQAIESGFTTHHDDKQEWQCSRQARSAP